MARYRYSARLEGPTRVAVPERRPSFEAPLRDVEQGLSTDRLVRVRRGAGAILDLLCSAYGLPRLELSVYDRPRPALGGRRFSGELHGDYRPPGRIRIWARTCKRGQRVAFLTFLDTLLHEFLHHYDLTYLKLPDTVHSESFYKRLGSLRWLVRRPPQPTPPSVEAAFASTLDFSAIFQAIRRDVSERRAPDHPSQPLLPF